MPSHSQPRGGGGVVRLGDMVAWGILKKDFHILSDEDIPGGGAADVMRATPTNNPTTSSAIGGVAAVNSNHSSNGTIGKGFSETQDVEKRLEGMRNKLLDLYEDVFTDELGETVKMRGDPVQLEVKSETATPYHCWTPVEVSANHEKEARRMVQSMVEAGIIKEVNRSTEWCAKGFFVEKPGMDGKLHMVTDFQNLNQNLKRPVWPFSTTEVPE